MAEALAARSIQKNPELKIFVERVQRDTEESVQNLLYSSSGGLGLLRQACTTQFSDLASGAWQLRTPNVYKFLADAAVAQ